MKTTLEVPDQIFRKAKATAALRGIPLRQLFTEALTEKISPRKTHSNDNTPPPWMAGFGALSDLREENKRINSLIEEEFDQLEKEDLL